LKISHCFTEPQEKQEWDNSTLDKSFDSTKTEGLFKMCRKDLESTFGDENILSFKVKPPKRKRNMMAKIKNGTKLPNE
jgi:hypothetical protein